MHYVSPVLSYYGLRSYGGGEQEIGAEKTPQQYVAHLVEVFRAVHRVLRDDGTLWCVLGDSYASGSRTTQVAPGQPGARPPRRTGQPARAPALSCVAGKNLMMIPHRVALALQADGWIVRNDCVWAKGSAMPESVQDRFSRAHEYVFHLSKRERYYFDALAVAEPCVKGAAGSLFTHGKTGHNGMGRVSQAERVERGTRNRRSVLHINPQPFTAADYGVKDIDHYAVFPEKLVEILTLCSTSEAGCCPRCGTPFRRVVERNGGVDRAKPLTPKHATAALLGVYHAGQEGSGLSRAGWRADPPRVSRARGWKPGCSCEAGPPIPCTTLDPFLGSGTTALVSKRLGRSCVGIELNESYCEMARRRVESVPYTLFSSASTQGAAR